MDVRPPKLYAAAALWAAAFVLSPAAAANSASAHEPPGTRADVAVNLSRVKPLLGGNARAIWIGDSWSLLQNSERVPYGSLLTWPVGRLGAVCAGFRAGTVAFGRDHTAGEGRMEYVDGARQWRVETDAGLGQQYFGLPLLDATEIRGAPTLVLDHAWPGFPRLQSLYANNAAIRRGDLPPFAQPGDLVRCRVLYYAPHDPANLVSHIALADGQRRYLGAADLRAGARPLWHLGENPGGGIGREAVPSQVNAYGLDVVLDASQALGPEIVIGEDLDHPFVGSGDYWHFAGAVFYQALPDGSPLPGYYHSGLSGNSWSFAGLADDTASSGGKNFSDEQLLHWLDVTTLDRAQIPVVILHVATEDKPRDEIESAVRRILDRFRRACAQVGTAPPRFLLVGSYMHRILDNPPAQTRGDIERLCELYRELASTEPDCAYFSLYHATDGVFFTSDDYGGPGTQQASRDWLDSHGWSSITYGSISHNLSTPDGGGLDGILVGDGVHAGSTPAGAFFAKLIGDAILEAECRGDFNADGLVNTQDVLAFLNAWGAGAPEADYDDDDVITTLDVLAFLNAWNTPC